MKEVKTPKKPLIFYYAVAMLAVFLFNFFAMPWLAQHQIKEVDYNTFVEMVEQDKVGKVEIQEQDNRILFTDKDESVIYGFWRRAFPSRARRSSRPRCLSTFSAGCSPS